MKPNPQQLSLFSALPLSQRFMLEPSPDEIRICTSCQRQIIVRRRTAEGLTVAECAMLRADASNAADSFSQSADVAVC